MRTLSTFLILLSSLTAIAQHAAPRTEDPAAWIEAASYDQNATPPENETAGSYYLLIDEQENARLQERYIHHAYKILNANGLQEMSDVSVDFDPSYQELIFHAVKIIRNGQPINKLSNNIRVLQRETSMERFLYDGRHTAVINMDDVRAGDIVEFAYTIKGYNPVFGDRISRWLYFDHVVGFEKLFRRIVLAGGREPAMKFSHEHLRSYKKETTKHGLEFSWTVGQTRAVLIDNNIPPWHDPFQFVGISDYHTWNEVAAWADELFKVHEDDFERIIHETNVLFKKNTKEDNAIDIVRFVQNEIRYLGFETGLNSHKPHSPAKVLQQRFGDCKDKSLLLVCMLRAKGIQAWPVLVSTSIRDKVRDLIPGPFVFNHCVVKIRLNDDEVYVDPTISNQGGALRAMNFPTYGAGLVVSNETQDLAPLPTESRSEVIESYVVDSPTFSGDATLTVTTTYTGGSADYQRDYFSGTNILEIQKGYLNFYAGVFNDIQALKDIKHTDDRFSNTFVVEEKYSIPEFWKPQSSDDDIIRAEWYSLSIESYFNINQPTQRTAPYHISYPTNVTHRVTFNLPEEWPLDLADVTISGDAYTYHYTTESAGKSITANTSYVTHGDHVAATDFSKFVEDHNKMMGNLSFVFTYDRAFANAAGNRLPGTIVSILLIVLSLVGVISIYKRFDPPGFLPAREGDPIGGWLILIGIGIVFSPFRILYDILTDVAIADGSLWTQWFASREYGLGSLALLVHVYNIANLFFSSLLLVLFIKRRSSFPRLMTIGLAVTLVVTAVDTLVARAYIADASDVPLQDLIRSVFAALIWIPYLNMSSRVRETFVVRFNDDDDLNEFNPPVAPLAQDAPTSPAN